MSAIQQLQKTFDVNTQFVHYVKDWDGAVVLEVYHTPLTIAQKEKARRLLNDDKAVGDFGLQLVILKATDKQGTKLFEMSDIGDLKRTLPADVLDEMCLAMINPKNRVGEEEPNHEERKSDSES